jgi:hypothetical protein
MKRMYVRGWNPTCKGIRWRNLVVAIGGDPGQGPALQITGALGGIFADVLGDQFEVLAPGSGRLEQVVFKVRAAGWVKFPAGTYTATMVAALYGVAGPNEFTAAAGNAIASNGNLSVTLAGTLAVTIPWMIECEMQGDSTSGKLQGIFHGLQSNTLTDYTVMTNPPTGVIFTQTGTPVGGTVPSEPSLRFAAGVTLGGNAPAASVCNLGSQVNPSGLVLVTD